MTKMRITDESAVRFFEALADSTLDATDDELREELAARGLDPERGAATLHEKLLPLLAQPLPPVEHPLERPGPLQSPFEPSSQQQRPDRGDTQHAIAASAAGRSEYSANVQLQAHEHGTAEDRSTAKPEHEQQKNLIPLFRSIDHEEEEKVVELAAEIVRREAVGEWFPVPDRDNLLRELNKRLAERHEYTHDSFLRPLMSRIAERVLTGVWKELELEFGCRLVVCDDVEDIPSAASRWFLRELETRPLNDTVSITVGCGSTVASWADEVRRRIKHRLEVYSGIVLCNDVAQPGLPLAVAARLCGPHDLLHGYQLPGNSIASADHERHPNPRYVCREDLDKKLFTPASTTDFTFCGTGPITSSTGFGQYVSLLGSANALESNGAIGELFYWPFTPSGFLYDELGLRGNHPTVAEAWDALSPPLRNFYLRTFTLHWRANARPKGKMVLMAGGDRKVDLIWTILDVLRPLVPVDVLVTDRRTAAALLTRIREYAECAGSRPRR